MDIVLKETYNFYKQTRTNWTELKTVAAEQKLKLKRPKNVHGTRWVSHHFDALDSVGNNWPAMVVHLEHVHNGGASAKKREKVEHLLDI